VSIPVVDVSLLAINALLSKLSDPVTGLNPLWAQQAVAYSLDPALLNIDFTSNPSKNFVIGQVDPDQYEKTGNISYPFSCLYVLESVNQNLTKFNVFSGPVRAVLDVYLSWRRMGGILNFEAYSLCLESCIVSLVNGWQNQGWGQNLTYNGTVQCKRGPCTFSGENWRQKVGFSFMFQVDRPS
jgi:hypothetical protein